MLMRSTFLINQATHTHTKTHADVCKYITYTQTHTRCVKPHPVWVNVFMVEVIEQHTLIHILTRTRSYIKYVCVCGRYGSLAASNSIVLVCISQSRADKLNNCILSLKFDRLSAQSDIRNRFTFLIKNFEHIF